MEERERDGEEEEEEDLVLEESVDVTDDLETILLGRASEDEVEGRPEEGGLGHTGGVGVLQICGRSSLDENGACCCD